MDTNPITKNIATAMGIEPEKAASVASELTKIITEQIVNGNSVAIPGFGQFDTVNQPEQIITDLSTGKRLMLPPVIEISFTPATAITKEKK